jgi:hypothetical protein
MAPGPRRCRRHHVFPRGPPLARRPSCATGAFLEDPGVAVGIVEEAVSGLVQRQEYGAQKEGAGRQRLAVIHDRLGRRAEPIPAGLVPPGLRGLSGRPAGCRHHLSPTTTSRIVPDGWCRNVEPHACGLSQVEATDAPDVQTAAGRSRLPPLGTAGRVRPASTLVQQAIHRIILAALVATSIPGPSRPA